MQFIKTSLLIICLTLFLTQCDFINDSTKVTNLTRKQAHDISTSVDSDIDVSALIKHWKNTYNSWQSALDNIEASITTKKQLSQENISDYILTLEDINTESRLIAINLTKEQAKIKALNNALNQPHLAEDNSSVSNGYEVLKTEKKYRAQLTSIQDKLKLIDLVQARIKQIQANVTKISQDYLIQELSQQTLPKAGIFGWLNDLKISAVNTSIFIRDVFYWFKNSVLSSAIKLPHLFLFVIIPLSVSLLIRWLISRSIGFQSKVENPQYRHQIGAYLSEGFANILFPLLVLWILYSIALPQFFDGDMAFNPKLSAAHAFITGLFVFALFFFVPIMFARTILSPKRSKWRISQFDFLHAGKIFRRLSFLGLIFSLHLMLGIWQNQLQLPSTVYYFINLSFIIVEVIAYFRLLPKKLWSPNKDVTKTVEPSLLVSLATKLHYILLPASLVASLFGYIEASNYILRSTVLSFGIIVLFLRIIQPFTMDVLTHIITQPKVRETFDLKIVTIQRIKNITTLIITPLLFIGSLFASLRIWGVPQSKLKHYSTYLVDGFQIGSMTISITNILLAFLTFFVIMYLTQSLRKYIINSALNNTGLSLGSKHAISAAIGYIGFIVAIITSIAAAGVEMKSIALVASALSIGIGFGLREIVSNFVSGIILIAERPIKVGDWVRIGDEEGTVREINFRSTEIETFKKSNIIIPNAQILTSSVVNMTHRNDIGRIDIEIGIGYQENIDDFKTLALSVLNNNESVAKRPEPQVYFTNHGDSALLFKLTCFSNNITKNRLILASNLRSELHHKMSEAAIDIPFPQRVVHLPSEASITNPVNEHPDIEDVQESTQKPDVPATSDHIDREITS